MQIAKLALALSKAQHEIKGATKDTTNPFFKAKYADLASVWEACREVLAKNELSVAQPTGMVDGKTVLRTILMHSSGEFVEGILPLHVAETATPQQVGSAITYARRYALAAMVGVSPQEDDDGNSASEAPKKPVEAKPNLNELKTSATAFAEALSKATDEDSLNAIVEKNNKLMLDLKTHLPTWYEKLSVNIVDKTDALRK